MTLNNGSKDSVEPQNSGSKAAYVPKKGDIISVLWYENPMMSTRTSRELTIVACDGFPEGETIYEKGQEILVGITLARIEAEYVKKVELGEIQRKRDKKLIKNIHQALWLMDFCIDKELIEAIFAEVDLEEEKR